MKDVVGDAAGSFGKALASLAVDAEEQVIRLIADAGSHSAITLAARHVRQVTRCTRSSDF